MKKNKDNKVNTFYLNTENQKTVNAIISNLFNHILIEIGLFKLNLCTNDPEV